MTALRMLGLVVLAAICLGIFLGAYMYLQELSKFGRANEVLLQLCSEIRSVISTGDNRENIEVKIPSGYVLSFDAENGQLVIDGIRTPEDGFSLPINGPDLGPGEHVVSIVLENGLVRVFEVF